MNRATLVAITVHAWSGATASNEERWSSTAVYSNHGSPPPLLVDFDDASAHYAAIGASMALARAPQREAIERAPRRCPRARPRADWLTMPRRAPRRI